MSNTLEFLDDKAIDNTLWLPVHSRNFDAICCGCQRANAPRYTASIVRPDFVYKSEIAKYEKRLTGCENGKHGVCNLCQSCGKKLGFEW